MSDPVLFVDTSESNVTVTGSLNVTDLTTLTGDTRITGETSITGNMSITGNLSVNRDISINVPYYAARQRAISSQAANRGIVYDAYVYTNYPGSFGVNSNTDG